jgi:hypothetical protein
LAGCCECGSEPPGCVKCGEMLTYQKGLCSLEFMYFIVMRLTCKHFVMTCSSTHSCFHLDRVISKADAFMFSCLSISFYIEVSVCHNTRESQPNAPVGSLKHLIARNKQYECSITFLISYLLTQPLLSAKIFMLPCADNVRLQTNQKFRGQEGLLEPVIIL